MIFLLHQSIERAAKRWPGKLAFRSGGLGVDFTEFDLMTNRLANLLLEQGVKKGDRVGIYLPRCIDSAVAVYGILKAGAVYVPLDPFSPASHISALLNELGIEIMVTNKQQRRRLPEVVAKPSSLRAVIGYEGEVAVKCLPPEAINLAPASAPKIATLLEDDLAYIITTSGSTGRPKGIMHTHRSGLAYIKVMQQAYHITEADVLGNHSALHFDMSTLAYFAGPLTGATTVIATDAQVRMPVSLAAMIAAEKITIWYSVPLALQQMYLSDTMGKLDLSALRLVIYGGEPFVVSYLRALMEMLPGVMFTNHYGPAEVNGCISYNLTEPPSKNSPIPIGFAHVNTELLIVDENDEEVAPNEPGLLLARCASRMRGYWKKPELTKKSLYQRMRIPGFVETFYRTGDLVMMDNSGLLHFLGRKDRQVKVRGHRVELDEVENVVNTAASVQEAAVFASPKGLEERKILLLAVLAPGHSETQASLAGYLRKRLPEYALPESIIFTDALPRSSGGKIDRLLIERNYSKQKNFSEHGK